MPHSWGLQGSGPLRETRAMTAIPALTPTAIGKPPPKANPHRRCLIFTPFSLPSRSGTGWLRAAVSLPGNPSRIYHRSLPTRAVSLTPQLVVAHQHRAPLDISTGVTSILAFQTLQPTAQTSEMDGTTLKTHTTVTAYRLSDMTL